MVQKRYVSLPVTPEVAAKVRALRNAFSAVQPRENGKAWSITDTVAYMVGKMEEDVKETIE